MSSQHGWSKRASLAAVAVTAALAAGGVAGARSAEGTSGSTPVVRQSAVALRMAMRKLWEDHITWTRNVIISFEVNDPNSNDTLPDLSAALDRLFQNQADIGDAIKPYYGDANGDKLTSLLHDHIAIAGEILNDVKTGDTAGYQDANARWYANAHAIAVFLSQTLSPPLGSLSDMDQMMKEHLDATTSEVVARATGDWTGDVAAYEKVHAQILGMADMLSDGIVDNFPKAFH